MSNPRRPIASHKFRWIVLISLLLLELCAMLLLVIFNYAQIARAQIQNLPCSPPPYPPVRAIQLIEEIRQSEPGNIPRGEFARRDSFVTLEGDEIVCLAASPDGRAYFQIDDQLEFQVTHADGNIAAWTHDFYDSRTGGITSAPPQDVSRLFARGLNGIRITLRDFLPRYYSASAVWLIIWQAPQTPAPRATQTSIRGPTPTGIVLPTQLVDTPSSTQLTRTPSPNPTPIPVSSQVAISAITFPYVEQGQPFTVAVEIIPSPLAQIISVRTNIRTSDGRLIVKGMDMIKEGKTNVFSVWVPGISETGTYLLTLDVEGNEPNGNKFNQGFEVSFVVEEPSSVRVAKLGIAAGIGLLILAWAIWALFVRPLVKLLIIGELQVISPEVKRNLRWNLIDFEMSQVSLGVGTGDILLPLLSNQIQVGKRARLIARLEGRKKRITPLIVGLDANDPVVVNGTVLIRGKGRILFDQSTLEVAGYILEYRTPVEEY